MATNIPFLALFAAPPKGAPVVALRYDPRLKRNAISNVSSSERLGTMITDSGEARDSSEYAASFGTQVTATGESGGDSKDFVADQLGTVHTRTGESSDSSERGWVVAGMGTTMTKTSESSDQYEDAFGTQKTATGEAADNHELNSELFPG